MSVLRTTLLAVTACFLWSTAFLALKLAMQYEQPIVLAGLRFILAGSLLLAWLILHLKKSPQAIMAAVWHERWLISRVAFFQSFLVYLLINSGVKIAGGALGALVVGLSPIVVAFIAHFALPDDRLTLRKLFSLLLGAGGLLSILAPRLFSARIEQTMLTGIGLLVLSNFSSAIGNITVHSNSRDLHPVTLNAFQLFSGGLALFLVGWGYEYNFTTGLFAQLFTRPAGFYLTLLWLAALSALAFSIWFHLLQQPGVRVSSLNIWKFIMPVNGALLSWLFLPESPDAWSLLAMVLIGSAVINAFWPSFRASLKSRRQT